MKRGLTGDSGLSPLGTARARLEPAAALPDVAASLLEDANLGPEEAFLVWQLTALAGELDAGERQILASTLAGSLVAVAQGSTRLLVGEQARAVLTRLPDLVGPPGSARPLVLEGAHLYHHKHFASEQRIATLVKARLAADATRSPDTVQAAVTAVAGTARPTPSEEQLTAVRSALGRRLAVIAGAPGTGKTTVAVTLLRALVRLGVPSEAVAFTAPTGKAANRLQESLLAGLAAIAEDAESSEDRALLAAPPAAATLHRLLGYSPSARAFAYHEHSPLPYRVVIVDESSMVDLLLMDRLLRALAPDASLVLLGDADQLPSVEAGAVFRDLARLGTRLAHSHRQDPAQAPGRRILDLAAAVRAGDEISLDRPETAADLIFQGAELLPASEREALLERWYTDRIAASPDLEHLRTAVLPLGEAGFSPETEARLDALFAHYQRFRLLAVTRGRPTGADDLNAWMHRRLGGTTASPVPGEPLLMLRNDYDRALWNGDQGLCVRVREEGRAPRLAAAFKVGDHWSAWHLESLRDSLTLAFAMTVHKSQGSEYDHIALILPELPSPSPPASSSTPPSPAAATPSPSAPPHPSSPPPSTTPPPAPPASPKNWPSESVWKKGWNPPTDDCLPSPRAAPRSGERVRERGDRKRASGGASALPLPGARWPPCVGARLIGWTSQSTPSARCCRASQASRWRTFSAPALVARQRRRATSTWRYSATDHSTCCDSAASRSASPTPLARPSISSNLARATPLLAREVVLEGVPLLGSDPLARFDFEIEATRRWEDTRRLRRQQQLLLRERARLGLRSDRRPGHRR